MRTGDATDSSHPRWLNLELERLVAFAGVASGLTARPLGLSQTCHAPDGDQRQAEVAHPGKDSVKGGLVGHSSGEFRFTVGEVADREAVKPLRPGVPQVPLHPNLKPLR